MQNKKVNRILIATSITMSLAVTFVGCGSQNLTKEKKLTAATSDQESKKTQTDKSTNSSLSLATPPDLPSDVDEVEISLSRVTMSFEINKKYILPVTYLFTLDGQPIQIKDLEVGDYLITVTYKKSATASVYSTGQGRATVEAGKLATAQIAMTKVDDATGGLVIVPQDGKIVCPAIAKAPVCVWLGAPVVISGALVVGVPQGRKGRWYSYQRKANSCEYEPLPDHLEVLPSNECW
ncbi:MAG: hypothetical protein FJ146_09995 [Deltaproteobacteria bacterium]|nr:hypothetical protein [Deltaproteobacteria bacterium]